MRVPEWGRRVIEGATGNLLFFILAAAAAAVWAAMSPIISAPHAWSWPTGIIVFLVVLGLLLFAQNQLSAYLDHRRRTSISPPAQPTSQALYEFWLRRSDGPRISDVFKNVQEAWVVMINGRGVRSSMDLRDTHITRMILLHPDADDVDAIAKSEGRPRQELAAEIRGVTDAAEKVGITVKWFRGPIIPMIIGNPNSADAWVKGDLLSIYVQPDDRLSVRVRDPNAVRVVREMHKRMWKDAETPSSVGALPREKQRVEVERLAKMAADDDANMDRLIHHLPGYAQTRPHLNASDPYVDLEFAFVNASAFDLTFRRVIGSVSYQGEPFRSVLTSPGQVVSATAFLPILIRHGEQSGFTLRQWVSHAAAQQILAEIQRSGTVVLDTRPIAICFVYRNHLGDEKEACVGIPGLPYEITQAA